ncbi:TIR domain-containing protein [bacterium JGI 053]|nr:TIR domain-containing protein [bacterium JGI 053]
MIPVEVFLSHASPDRELADHLVDILRRHNLPVWYSPTNIVGAQQWHDEIGAALDRCDWFVVLLTRSSVQSMWVKRELMFALQQNRYESHIVPLLVESCDFGRLSWVLSSIQIIDLQPGLEEGCRELLRLWGIGYRP